MIDAVKSDIVSNAKLAIKIAELLCEALYRDLEKQRPLHAADEGTYWRVEGSRNRDGAINGRAEFFVSIGKNDCQITDIGEYMRCPPTPKLTQMLEEHFQTGKENSGGQIIGADNDTDDAEKRSRGMLLLTSMARGGVVFSKDLAVKIGELFCDAHYGDQTHKTPLTAVDKETCWRVEGNRNAEAAQSFYISIQKYDARVTEIGA